MIRIHYEKMLTSCFQYESLYQKGWQFSCHLKTGVNLKGLSLKNDLLHTVLVRKFIPKGVVVPLPLNNRQKG